MDLEFDLRHLDKKQLAGACQRLMEIIKRRFSIGLIVIIGLLTLFYLLAELTLYQQSVDNQRIHATLQQQSLNHEIQVGTKQLLVTQNIQARRFLLGQIKQAAEKMRIQQRLIMKDHFLVIDMQAPQRAVYLESPYKLNQRVKDFTQAVDLLSAVSSDKITVNTPQIAIISEEAPGHMHAALSAAIAAHLESAAKSGEFFMWLCSVMWLLTVILIVLLGLFVFRPIYSMVKKSFTSLVESAERVNHDWRLEEEMRKHFKREAVQQKAVLNSLEKIIISTDTFGTIKTFNKFAERKLGFLEIEVIGKRTVDFFHDPDDLQSRAQALSDVYEKEVLVGFETLIAKSKHAEVDDYSWLLRDKSGQSFHMVLNYRAIFNDQGEITGFLAEGCL